jgi:hypothetical protein
LFSTLLPGGFIFVILKWLLDHFSLSTTLKLLVWFAMIFGSVIGYLLGNFTISAWNAIIAAGSVGFIITLLLYVSLSVR